MTRRLSVVALAVALAVALGGQAYGQDAFDKLWDEAVILYHKGEYDKARQAFERLRDLRPDIPGPYRYLGRIAKVQKRWQDCIENATIAVRLKPDSPQAPAVRADLDACRQALNRPAYPGQIPDKQGGLVVITNVEGASVSVDGIKKGATPLDPFPVNPGRRKVRVERKGYLPVAVEVDVVETIVVDLEVTLEVDPEAGLDERIEGPQDADDIKVGWIIVSANVVGASVRLDGQTPSVRPDGSIETTPGVHTLEVEAPRHEPWRRRIKVARGQKRTVKVALKASELRRSERTKAWLSFGVAAAAGASGIVFGLLENQAYETARDWAELERQRPPMSNVPSTLPEGRVRTWEEIEAKRDEGERHGLIANVSFGVAAVALGVSIYYFIQERPAERPGYELPMAIAPQPGGGAGVVFTRELDW